MIIAGIMWLGRLRRYVALSQNPCWMSFVGVFDCEWGCFGFLGKRADVGVVAADEFWTG